LNAFVERIHFEFIAKGGMRRETGNPEILESGELIITELRVLTLTKRNVVSGNEIAYFLNMIVKTAFTFNMKDQYRQFKDFHPILCRKSQGAPLYGNKKVKQ